jgi:hypothetical protein
LRHGVMMTRTSQPKIALSKLLRQLATGLEAIAIPAQEGKQNKQDDGEASNATNDTTNDSLLLRG